MLLRTYQTSGCKFADQIKITIIWVILIIMASVGIPQNLIAQDTNYIENNDEYVDVVIEPGQDAADAPENQRTTTVNWNQNNQLHTGQLNYGYVDSVYHQFSGEDIYKDGNPADATFFTNVTWTNLRPLNLQIPQAWSLGGEFLYFSSNSESVYTGDDDVTGSLIDMNLFMTTMAVKVFVFDPVREFLQPYWGVGWGFLFGAFDTDKKNDGGDFSTSFFGLQSYQLMGAQIKLGERFGILAEIKNMRASATTSNDPFDQGNGDSVDLVFDGVIVGFSVYYRL